MHAALASNFLSNALDFVWRSARDGCTIQPLDANHSRISILVVRCVRGGSAENSRLSMKRRYLCLIGAAALATATSSALIAKDGDKAPPATVTVHFAMPQPQPAGAG